MNESFITNFGREYKDTIRCEFEASVCVPFCVVAFLLLLACCGAVASQRYMLKEIPLEQFHKVQWKCVHECVARNAAVMRKGIST